jgi:CrcB protein
MKYLILIALGGATGAVSRYLLANWVHRLWEGSFPVGTLLVNAVGSLLIGVLYVIVMERAMVHPDWRGALIVGLLGAFTTFSTFSLEAVHLIETGHLAQAALYVAVSVVACIALAALAMQVTRALI